MALGGTALAATVVAVDSGDTLRVREGGQVRQIRLACLEAPALSQAPHGEQARATLRRLLPEGSAVLLRPISRAGDPSGVPVVEVSTRSGSVNIELVRAGQAFTTLDTQPQCDALRYAEAENTARFQRLGVWRVEGGIPRPWQWRLAEAEWGARRAREQALRTQPWPVSRPRRTLAFQPRQGPFAAAGTSFPQGGYEQCLATAREKFLEGSRGIAPPAGLLEGFCSCLIQPKASDSPASLGQRCTRQLLDRISRIASPG